MNKYTRKSAFTFAAEVFMNSEKLSFSKADVLSLLKKAQENEVNSTKGIFTFGKYAGKTFKAVHEFDPQYLEWLKTQDWYQKKTDIHDEIDSLTQ
tara:strand:+ start:92 stop:376 length:285 start_codon:yes stop_codon:yes gene_type:complete